MKFDQAVFLKSPALKGVLVSVVCFFVYLKTLAPTVGFIDSGELAAVACTLGIAHPTGYPLFTLLGWIFSHVPFMAEEIARLNLMAALFCSMAVYLFFDLALLLLSAVYRRKGGEGARKRAVVPAIGATLLLAFSETFWSQALTIEVYSLHLLFMMLLLNLFFRASSGRLFGKVDGEGGDDRTWMIFAFSVGLAFTNHMTVVLLAPGFLYLYFSVYRFGRPAFIRLGKMSLPFLLGLSPYIYLPVRASQDPLFQWGDPSTFERFFCHLGGKQYSVWIFSSMETAGRQFQYFLSTLPGELTLVGLAAAVIGFFTLFRRNRRIAAGLLIFFTTCILYAVNYDIHDIDSYFLLAYTMLALSAAFGLAPVYRWLDSKLSVSFPAVVFIIGLSTVPLFLHYGDRDESANYLVEDYTRNMFDSFDSNAVVLSYQWDHWVSASYYYQYVRGVRPDVTVIDKELLRRSWYFKELETRYPRLLRSSRVSVDLFLEELHKFEYDLPYDPAVIQGRFVEMIRAFIRNSMAERPVYVTREMEPEFTTGLQRVPQGLAFRLVPEQGFYPTKRVNLDFRPLERAGRLEDQMKALYVEAHIARGAYYYTEGQDVQEASESLRLALSVDPLSERAGFWYDRVRGGR